MFSFVYFVIVINYIYIYYLFIILIYLFIIFWNSFYTCLLIFTTYLAKTFYHIFLIKIADFFHTSSVNVYDFMTTCTRLYIAPEELFGL